MNQISQYFKDLSTNSMFDVECGIKRFWVKWVMGKIFPYAINIIVLELVTYLIWKFKKKKKNNGIKIDMHDNIFNLS